MTTREPSPRVTFAHTTAPAPRASDSTVSPSAFIPVTGGSLDVNAAPAPKTTTDAVRLHVPVALTQNLTSSA